MSDPEDPKAAETVCRRKRRYSKGEAKAAVKGLQSRGAKGVEAFRCTECGAWHVGHPHGVDLHRQRRRWLDKANEQRDEMTAPLPYRVEDGRK